MVDPKRSGLTSALLLLITLSPQAPAQDERDPATRAPCPDSTADVNGRCIGTPGAPDTPGAGTGAGQQTAGKDASQAAKGSRGEAFRPTSPDASQAALPELEADRPQVGDAEMIGLQPEGPAGGQVAEPSEEAGRVPGPGADAARPTAPGRRADDPRLHEGLAWDYCGPRPGATRIAPAVDLAGKDQIPIDITADTVGYDRSADVIQLQGDVEILQEGRRLEADYGRYNRMTGDVKSSGHVFMESPGLRITGDTADYNLETKTGAVDKAGYRMAGNANLRGEAEKARMLGEQQSEYEDIIYTTCPPGSWDWSIKASDLALDQESGLGTARHARIRIADIPVLYSPYLQFPIDGRRRTGLLIPTFGSSDSTGTDISLPFYWNIAPNMDATITPRLMTARGLMLGGQLRHLTSFQMVEIDGEILPKDQKDAEEGMRGALRIRQDGHLGTRWRSAVDYASVSDDQYLEDFGNSLDVTSVRNLTQRGDIRYGGQGWSFLGRFQQFQTVDTSIAPENRPYGQLPHIEVSLSPKTWKDTLEYSLVGEYDYFDHDATVHGNRLVAVPTLRVPLRRSYGYVIPRTRVYFTSYDLIDQDEGAPSQMSHVIPSFDLDAKLIFEREAKWLGTETLQTLEPRLYYVLTSHEDQSFNPEFDTTALDFSFSSLFRPNRFTGYDRIGDENRLTLGLTSRTIATQSGDELFRASVGQIYYFDERRVQLSGDEAETDITSSVAGEISARLHRDWTATASLQWNPNETETPWEKQVLQVRYAPDADHLLNLAYRYNLGDNAATEYEDADLSFQMPLGSNVNLVGRWLYSMLNDETVEAVAGIEFGRCCWRLRVLGQHLKRSSSETASTSVMLQLELAGLGTFGNRIDKLLERGIYGYHSE